eukprot:3918952-Rhodomonas_salina.1
MALPEYLKLTSDFHVFAHRPSPPDGKPIGPNGTATDDSQPTAGLPSVYTGVAPILEVCGTARGRGGSGKA